MRINKLQILNFRAIKHVTLSNLSDAVVIAGPNGCGKSCIFDAIRLLKSAYGQYHQHEWQWWFNEFQINVQNLSREARRVLNDPKQSLVVKAEIMLSDGEKKYLEIHGQTLINQMTWSKVLGRRMAPEEETIVISPGDKRMFGNTVKAESDALRQHLQKELRKESFLASLEMKPDGDVHIMPSPVIEIAFSIYAPEHLGVIDYHGPNRTYSREQVGSVNLSVTDNDQRMRQHALYNTQNKYTNVKTEMASAYVQELLSKESGIKRSSNSDLIETLKELFELFFPGKRFLGPQPTAEGRLLFPVELRNGRQHDIDDLSSGEKEVLLGYLRLRNNAPHGSVILLDEPELHLNPRLIRGLPRFYQRHLGEAYGNQLWMITHSDALLRESIGEHGFSVYHMQSSSATSAEDNQAHILTVSGEIQRAIIDLVGDLATYSPLSKVVILEGGGDSEFDISFVNHLFPEFGERVNLISGGSKKRVWDLHKLLETSKTSEKLNTHFFSIVDFDFDGQKNIMAENKFMWDVYHIENYLLCPKYIQSAFEMLVINREIPSEDLIMNHLKICAEETVDSLVRIKMEQYVNKELLCCMHTKIDPKSKSYADAFQQAASRTHDDIQNSLSNQLHINRITEEEKQIRDDLQTALYDNTWISKFRGRDILKKYSDKSKLGVQYENFRNVIVNRMRIDGYRPEGMEKIINKILSA